MSADFSQQPDIALVQALRTGETAALAVLYDRYADILYGLAFKLLKSTEEAEDVVQDIFVTLYQKDPYDAQRGTLLSFLKTMTYSRSIDRLRSRGRKQTFLNRWHRAAEQAAPEPIQQVMYSEQATVVRAALAQLPSAEQEILRIAYYEGLSQSAIAKRLDLPLGTVKSRSRQGLKKLRRALHPFITRS